MCRSKDGLERLHCKASQIRDHSRGSWRLVVGFAGGVDKYEYSAACYEIKIMVDR